MVAGVAVMIRILVVLVLLGAGGTLYIKKTSGLGPGEWIASRVAQAFGKKTGVDALVTGGEVRRITPLLYAPKPGVLAVL